MVTYKALLLIIVAYNFNLSFLFFILSFDYEPIILGNSEYIILTNTNKISSILTLHLYTSLRN